MPRIMISNVWIEMILIYRDLPDHGSCFPKFVEHARLAHPMVPKVI